MTDYYYEKEYPNLYSLTKNKGKVSVIYHSNSDIYTINFDGREVCIDRIDLHALLDLLVEMDKEGGDVCYDWMKAADEVF